MRLVTLPDLWMERANERSEASRSALAGMNAAAVAILLSCPMRMKNLAGLDLDRYVIAQRSGTHTTYTLHIEGVEVKNGEPIEVKLSPKNSRLLHTYIQRFRHRISEVKGTALFSNVADGLPRAPGNLAQELQKAIHRETGLTVYPHLFRHVAVKLYLSERPGDFETFGDC